MKHPPRRRLLEDPLASSRMREELQRAVDRPPLDYDTDAGLALLRKRLDLGPSGASDSTLQQAPEGPLPDVSSGGSAVTGGGAASSGLAIKLAASLAGLTAVVTAGFWAASPSARPTPPPQTQEVPRSPRTGGPFTQPEAANTGATTGSLAREASELGRVRQLLAAGDAEAALRLAEQGHARFVGGALYPEREALSILSLCELGKRGEAQRRAEVFARGYPEHPMQDRVRAALSTLEVQP